MNVVIVLLIGMCIVALACAFVALGRVKSLEDHIDMLDSDMTRWMIARSLYSRDIADAAVDRHVQDMHRS